MACEAAASREAFMTLRKVIGKHLAALAKNDCVTLVCIVGRSISLCLALLLAVLMPGTRHAAGWLRQECKQPNK